VERETGGRGGEISQEKLYKIFLLRRGLGNKKGPSKNDRGKKLKAREKKKGDTPKWNVS